MGSVMNINAVFDLLSDALREKLRDGRARIRQHRDQVGDDRCWLDDFIVWAFLGDSGGVLSVLPLFHEAMDQCRMFYLHRKALECDPISADAILEKEKWDEDIATLSIDELCVCIVRLKNTIRTHRDVTGRPRTLDDDRALYAILPEKMPADFRLPSEAEFLGEARAPKAGCPSFWSSHAHCSREVHDFHKWGPCT